MLTPNQLKLQLGKDYSCDWKEPKGFKSVIQVTTPFTLPDGTVIDVCVIEISQQRNEGIVLPDLGETAG